MLSLQNGSLWNFSVAPSWEFPEKPAGRNDYHTITSVFTQFLPRLKVVASVTNTGAAFLARPALFSSQTAVHQDLNFNPSIFRTSLGGLVESRRIGNAHRPGSLGCCTLVSSVRTTVTLPDAQVFTVSVSPVRVVIKPLTSTFSLSDADNSSPTVMYEFLRVGLFPDYHAYSSSQVFWSSHEWSRGFGRCGGGTEKV